METKQETTELRQLGQSNVNASVVTFGAWAIGGAMWGPADEDDAVRAIQTSIEMGVVSIDTAPIYGLGQSERLVGKAIAGKRDKVRIFTKFGMRTDLAEGEYFFEMDNLGRPAKVYINARKESVLKECEQSLRNLRTDYIDLYQCHWRDHTTALEETMEVLDHLIKQGKIRAAGVSNFTVEEIAECRRYVPLASDQAPYSMVNRGIEKDVLPYCLKNNVGVLAYSPLQRGLLTGKFKPDHAFGPHDHRANLSFFKPENIRKVNDFLQSLRPIADTHRASIAQLVINWTICQPGITTALVGARNAKQAAENAQAALFQLTAEEVQEINARLDELHLEGSE